MHRPCLLAGLVALCSVLGLVAGQCAFAVPTFCSVSVCVSHPPPRGVCTRVWADVNIDAHRSWVGCGWGFAVPQSLIAADSSYGPAASPCAPVRAAAEATAATFVALMSSASCRLAAARLACAFAYPWAVNQSALPAASLHTDALQACGASIGDALALGTLESLLKRDFLSLLYSPAVAAGGSITASVGTPSNGGPSGSIVHHAHCEVYQGRYVLPPSLSVGLVFCVCFVLSACVDVPFLSWWCGVAR